MTNTETGSTIYFIDFIVSNTAYSIDILIYPVPASLTTGYTSSITFIGTEKNPRLTLPAGMLSEAPLNGAYTIHSFLHSISGLTPYMPVYLY